MKRILFITLALCLVAGSASATDMGKRFGLGFNNGLGREIADSTGIVSIPGTPIGGRYWLSPKVGFDIGFGISVDDDGTDTSTSWAISGGLPINVIDVGDRVNFNFLPWVQYTSVDAGKDTNTYFDIVAGLEFEVFVTKDLSVSASHGVAFEMYSPGGAGESTTDINTFGKNITQFGVHYYLPGGASQ